MDMPWPGLACRRFRERVYRLNNTDDKITERESGLLGHRFLSKVSNGEQANKEILIPSSESLPWHRQKSVCISILCLGHLATRNRLFAAGNTGQGARDGTSVLYGSGFLKTVFES